LRLDLYPDFLKNQVASEKKDDSTINVRGFETLL
jgi:hypothetical protein